MLDSFPLVIGRRSLHRTDTDLFAELYQKSKTAPGEERKAALFRLIDLYQDGLLPLDIYEDYTAVDRE
jgi:hypothetical protein